MTEPNSKSPSTSKPEIDEAASKKTLINSPKEDKKQATKMVAGSEESALNLKRPSSSAPEMDEAALKKALMNSSKEDEQLATKMASLQEILPSSKKDVMSDEALKNLCKALGGDTDKKYDSDDSLNSESDNWDAETIAKKDKNFKEVLKSVSTIHEEFETANDIVNIGKGTKAEQEKRKKRMRDRKEAHLTEEEKATAENKRQKEKRKQQASLAVKVQVFLESKNDLRNIKCSEFALFLLALVDIVPEGTEADKKKDLRSQVRDVDKEAFIKRVQHYAPNRKFDVGIYQDAENFVLKMVRNIFMDKNVLEVVRSEKYGFNLSFKECLQVLENYYSLNKPPIDDGKSIKPLAIRIRDLVMSAYHVARNANYDFIPNDNLIDVICD